MEARKKQLAEGRHPPSIRKFLAPVRDGWDQNTTYQYKSLDEDKSNVRLLTLLPGKPSAELRVTLSNVVFDIEDPPIYEALSYVWGSTENPAFVTVGVSGKDTISVTRNLAIALPYLRYEDRPRVVWIDAVCVNQTDLAERSKQVQLMGSIYRLASRVIAWVGPEADGSSDTLKTLEVIGTNVEVDWITQIFKPATSSEISQVWGDMGKEHRPPLNEEDHIAIKAFVFRPWFERLWILQEIRLADHNAIIICGSAQMSWSLLRSSIFVLRHKLELEHMPWSVSEMHAYSNRLLMVNTLCQPVLQDSFVSRIESAQENMCSDPRDRVFPLLSIHKQGFVSTNAKLIIRPNYEATVAQVYQQTIRQIIEQDCQIDILTGCELRTNIVHELPSWVPDFSRSRLCRGIYNFYAAGLTFAEYDFSENSTLQVRGVSVCSLQVVQTCAVDQQTVKDILSAIRLMKPQMDLENSYIAGGTILHAYCEAFVCGMFADESVPSTNQRERGLSTEILRTIWETEMDWEDLIDAYTSIAVDGFLRGVLTYGKNRTICTTEQGYIVLAPTFAQPGDQVCGECYVPGLAAGEALAGPLPTGYRKVRALEPQKGWVTRIQNISTEEILKEDPRFDLSEYPEVGSEVEGPLRNTDGKVLQKQIVRILNEDSFQRRAYPWREENLRTRGAEIQDFNLE